MKALFIVLTTLLCISAYAQNTLSVHDISQVQLRIMDRYKGYDSLSRSNLFIDSIYSPYQKFWNGYLGNAGDVAAWLNEALASLPEWQIKNKAIDGTELLNQFYAVARDMETMTGYIPTGNWYVVYGPAWTDLGGLGDFAMLIDLAHESNSSNERILRMFPHELTHQIMTNVNTHKDSTAISAIIGEGFAVWMNEKYWKQKLTLAQNLGYTDEELQLCDKNTDALKRFFEEHKYSTDEAMINVFRNRNEKLNEKLPGAIGYYIGYRIVESYVRKNGADSWKDIFVRSPREIYEKSGF